MHANSCIQKIIRVASALAPVTALLAAQTARAEPTTAEILTAISRNVQQSEATSLQALYSLTITQYPKAQRQLIKSPDFVKHLAEITSDTNVSTYYVKRWSNGQRNAVRALEVESVNDETKIVSDVSGGHEGEKSRTVQYAPVPPRIIGAGRITFDTIGQTRPGSYSGISADDTPWGTVEQYLALAETNHRSNEGNNLGPGFISMAKAMTLLAKPNSVTFNASGQFCLLAWVVGESPSLDCRTARLDPAKSFLPIEVHSTMQDGMTSFEAQISYRSITLGNGTAVYLPDSIIGATFSEPMESMIKCLRRISASKKWGGDSRQWLVADPFAGRSVATVYSG